MLLPQLPFPAEHLQFMASFYSGIYDFHGNGLHSISSVPIFLIITVWLYEHFLISGGIFSL